MRQRRLHRPELPFKRLSSILFAFLRKCVCIEKLHRLFSNKFTHQKHSMLYWWIYYNPLVHAFTISYFVHALLHLFAFFSFIHDSTFVNSFMFELCVMSIYWCDMTCLQIWASKFQVSDPPKFHQCALLVVSCPQTNDFSSVNLKKIPFPLKKHHFTGYALLGDHVSVLKGVHV